MAPSELRRVGFFNVIDLNEVFAIYGLPSSYLIILIKVNKLKRTGVKS